MPDKNKDRAKLRLRVIRKAQSLDNVLAACRFFGMDHTSFYKYKKRYEQHGLAGLKDLPSTPHGHPKTTPPKVTRKIVRLASKHPYWGCVQIARNLQSEGISITPPTVQKILNKNALRTERVRVIKRNKRRRALQKVK